MGRFQDKVVLITGTGGGIGRAAAVQFASEGAKVFGCDIKVAGNLDTERMIRETGDNFTASQPVDLGDPDSAQGWVDSVIEATDRMDVLFNNASACRFVAFDQFSFDDWRWSMRNELDLVYLTTRAAWPHLQRQGGVVLNMASIAGIAGSGPGGAAHAAAKGAIIAFTKQLAFEGAPHGIRVLSISPGTVATPGTAPLLADPAMMDQMLRRNLIKRIASAEEIVPMALMLASEECGYMTGANVVIDGGRIAW